MGIVFRGAFAGLLLFLATGCSSSLQGGAEAPEPEEAVDETNPGSNQAESERADLKALDLFDADLLQQIETLQLGIDLAIEDDVRVCMAAAGFKYSPRSISQLARNPGVLVPGQSGSDSTEEQYFDSASQALDYVAGDEVPQEQDANSRHLESLSDAERRAWLEEETQCFVDASQEHENPLVSETSWFSLLSDEASERTFASAEYVNAKIEFDACMQRAGYADLDDVVNRLFEEADEVATRFQAGELSQAAAEEQLRETAIQERELSLAFGTCDEPLRQTEREVYAREMAIIAERDGDKAALWAEEFRSEIEPYLLDW
jgi:hypothetical protein